MMAVYHCVIIAAYLTVVSLLNDAPSVTCSQHDIDRYGRIVTSCVNSLSQDAATHGRGKFQTDHLETLGCLEEGGSERTTVISVRSRPAVLARYSIASALDSISSI